MAGGEIVFIPSLPALLPYLGHLVVFLNDFFLMGLPVLLLHWNACCALRAPPNYKPALFHIILV